jgi:GNAT superfamily N-acetyltransferase
MNPRRATISDALSVARVQVASWQTAYRGLMDQSSLDSLDPKTKVTSWESFITAPQNQVFVIEDKSNIIGYAHVCESRDEPDSAVGEIASMYVVPSQWRKGVGNTLLRAAEEWLRERGYRGITLWVLQANTQARRFYERFAYAFDGVSKVHPKSGLIEVRYRRQLRDDG